MSSMFGGKSPKKDEAAERRAKELQKQQMEDAKEKDSEIEEARARLRKKAAGRSSLLTGSAQGVGPSDTLG